MCGSRLNQVGVLYHFNHKFSHTPQPEKKPPFKMARTQRKIYWPSQTANFQNLWTYGQNGTVDLQLVDIFQMRNTCFWQCNNSHKTCKWCWGRPLLYPTASCAWLQIVISWLISPFKWSAGANWPKILEPHFYIRSWLLMMHVEILHMFNSMLPVMCDWTYAMVKIAQYLITTKNLSQAEFL